jgi:cation diffusion facilitator CzcD-associated flavoprotein CzcO
MRSWDSARHHPTRPPRYPTEWRVPDGSVLRGRRAVHATADMSRVCVIGAGSSGIASGQVLHARGIPFDCFEAGSAVGGNWRYDNDNGMSAAYRSLHAKSSRQGMQYAAFPMPDSYPTYLGHELIAQYLDAFVDHYGFRHRIQFRTEVVAVAPARTGGWDVTVRQRGDGAERTERYSAVLVANGHHWDPRYPNVPDAVTFRGQMMHSRHYRTPEPFPADAYLSSASAIRAAISRLKSLRSRSGLCSPSDAAPISCPNICSAGRPII